MRKRKTNSDDESEEDAQPPPDLTPYQKLPSRWTRRRARKAKLKDFKCKDHSCTYHTAHTSKQCPTRSGQQDSSAASEDMLQLADHSDSATSQDVPSHPLEMTKNEQEQSQDASMVPEGKKSIPTAGTAAENITKDNLVATEYGTDENYSTDEITSVAVNPGSQTVSDHNAKTLENQAADEDYMSADFSSSSETSDSDVDDGLEKLVMHHLDEAPNQPMPQPPEGLPNIDHDDIPEDRNPEDDPGDPDDPSDNENGDDDDGDEDDSDEDEGDTFSFEDVRMNTPLQFGHAGCTLREGILLNLALSVKYHWTYEALADSMASWSTALGRRGIIPETKKQLWSMVKKSEAGITKFAYCPNCLVGLGKLSILADEIIVCAECNVRTHKRKMPFFVSLSLKKQFQNLLSTPGMAHLLQYRERRRKHREDSMEDIFDGEVYRNLVADGTITENDYTYIFNTDGFKLFKHRSLSVWGLLLRLNELPPNIRQKYMFLAALWIDHKEPRMNTFMAPFVRQANKLSRDGLQWQRDGVNDTISKFIPIGLSVDAIARALCMNQHQFNGEWGCYVCTHQGIYLNGSMKYPILPHENLPPAMERTNQSIIEAMHLNVFHEGQKGPSQLMLLNHFDLAEGHCMDDLHPFYEGIAVFFFERLIPQLRNENQAFATVNFRMRNVRTPIQMARKWSSIRKRDSWKGSQWGYFIRYLAVLCFFRNEMTVRNLEHLSMLSYCLFVFSQDSISPIDFERASQYAERFITLFQQYYGPESMRFNIHMLTHAAQSRRRWGSAWTTSTFNFESWNRQLGLHVTSAKGAADQIVSRHFMKLYVQLSPFRNDISDRVKDHISDLLFATQRKLAEIITEDITVLGRGIERPATAEELNFLRREGIERIRITTYDRLLVRGIEYRVSTYHEDTRSDNSNVFLWDNRFFSIHKIIVVVQENDERVCWVLGDVHNVDYPIRYAHHIGHIVGSEIDFLRPDTFRVPVIKAVIQEQTYVVPMANCREID